MDEELSKGPDSIRRTSSDSDYYILDDATNPEEPVIDSSRSSWNVSVSTGSRAFLHCTIENAERKTVSVLRLVMVMVTMVMQVSWVKLRNMSNPGLLAVGQFVFSTDRRIGVTTKPAAKQWSLSIRVSRQERERVERDVCRVEYILWDF